MFSIFSLQMSVCRLQMHVFSLQMSIFRLQMQFLSGSSCFSRGLFDVSCVFPYLCGCIHSKRMKHILLYIVLLLLGALSACTGGDARARVVLAQVDSLLPALPDSALRLLQQVRPQSLWDEEVQARYALARTEAELRRGVPVRSDSQIQVAVAYYDKVQDVARQARAHYWAGQVYRRLGSPQLSIHHLRQAMDLAPWANDRRLTGGIYNSLAYGYVRLGLPERADSLYRLAGKVGRLLPDTVLWIETLCRRAAIRMNKGKRHYAEAHDMLLQAWTLLPGVTNQSIQSLLTATLSSLYARMHEGEKAVYFARQSLALQPGSPNRHLAWGSLGEAYYQNRQYDSAVHYLNKSLSAKGSYDIKANAYMRLADIYREQGDYEKSMRMERRYSAYKDSLLQQSTQTVAWVNAEQEAFATHVHRQNRQVVRYVIGGILILVVAMAGVWLVYWLRQRRHWQRKENQLKSREALASRKQQDLEEALQESHIRQQEQQSRLERQQSQISHLQELVQARHTAEQQNLKALKQEELEQQPVYVKMLRIMDDYARCAKSEEKMTESDWQQLEDAANRRWNRICLKLRKHDLTPREIHLCCLILADFPAARLVCLFERQRNFYYTMQKSILEKRFPHRPPTSSLKDILLQLVAEEPA